MKAEGRIENLELRIMRDRLLLRALFTGALAVWSSYIYHKFLKGQKNEEVDFTTNSDFCLCGYS